MFARVTVLAALLLAFTVCGAIKDKPFFVKTHEELLRGPPTLTSPTRADVQVQTKWITQKLNHFDDDNTRTYEMKYLQNDEFLTEGSPIFIYCGGEWDISPGQITRGLWYDLAREHKGLLIYSEHRYYGESVPTSDMSTANLQYLHVKQALEDLAHLIKTLKAETPGLANSKVLLAGGSYSATMVVWFKRLYPDLIAGGFASSAPLLAKVDFREYKEVVGKAYRDLGSQKCYDHIEAGFSELEYMFENKRSSEARAMLRLCSNFDNENDLDLWSLFGSLSNIFAGIAQYQSGDTIDFYCRYLLSNGDPASAIANFAYWAWGNQGCIDATYQSTINYYTEAITNFGAGRPWYYQTCNEYGWYQSSASGNQPFGRQFPATLYVTLCSDVFGPEFSNENINKNALQTNDDFGGMAPKIENVYMTHGSLDPWNPMGHGFEQGATIITNASHCSDFGSISDRDSPELRASKERLAALVSEWLN